MSNLNRRRFGKWILKGGILVPFSGRVIRAQVCRPNNLFTPSIVSGGGGATPAYVGITNATNGSGLTISLTRSFTTGNTAMVCVGWEDVAVATCVVTDGVNTYTGLTLANGQTAGAGPLCQMFRCININGGSRTILATFGASAGFSCMSVVEFSGGITAFDVEGFSTGPLNNTTAITSNFTTTAANEALVCAVKNYGGAAATPQASWTEVVDNTGSNGFEVQYRIVSATGTFSGSATYSPAQDYAIVAAGFK